MAFVLRFLIYFMFMTCIIAFMYMTDVTMRLVQAVEAFLAQGTGVAGPPMLLAFTALFAAFMAVAHETYNALRGKPNV